MAFMYKIHRLLVSWPFGFLQRFKDIKIMLTKNYSYETGICRTRNRNYESIESDFRVWISTNVSIYRILKEVENIYCPELSP